MNMDKIANNFLSTLHQNGGFYSSFDQTGKRVGPLVGYAGRYKDETGSHQYVGDVYANCSKIEKNASSLKLIIYDVEEHITNCLFSYGSGMSDDSSTRNSNRILWLGAPMGGIVTSVLLSLTIFPDLSQCGFLEKKVIELATQDARERTDLIMGRHDINNGDTIIPVEDVCNNFSTTDRMLQIISNCSNRIPFIFCLINRSGKTSYSFNGREIPIVSIVSANWPEYKQDDPEIRDYISNPNNLVLNPKQNWGELMTDMANRQ